MTGRAKLILVTREITSRLPRIRGLAFALGFVLRVFRRYEFPDVEVSVFGRKMLLNPSDLIGYYLIFTPQWFDHRERWFIGQILNKGDYVVDVGANVGAYTLYLAGLVGPSGLVVAIEAEQENAKRLKHNIQINSIHWATVLVCGVSDKRETLSLLLNTTGNAGGHSFFRKQSDVIKPPVQEVECHPLSELIDVEKVPKLVKLDIEGFEFRVLKQYLDAVPKNKWPHYIQLEDIPTLREDDAVMLALDRGYRLIHRYDYNVILEREIYMADM
jgi:FkbM family methyltransferase